jgi:poly-gamma-glutamate synthesis protein (capsule biosynthesis protein)
VEASQKIRLARKLSNLVIVSIHWGYELLAWPSVDQRNQAAWMISQGADIIFGHHPHVIQPMDIISGKPVYFSLGNHLFDQKYPETKKGLVAEIRISDGRVRCGGIRTRAPVGSSIPYVEKTESEDIREYEFSLRGPFAMNDFTLRPRASKTAGDPGLVLEGLRNGRLAWVSRPAPVVSMETGHLNGPNAPELILALQKHKSVLDGEEGVRPYVYDLGDNGLIAKWRGSALAWPLLDATLLESDDSVVCALHRGDSFIKLEPKTKNRRVAAYRWNGFGFSGIEDPGIINRCRSMFDRRSGGQ